MKITVIGDFHIPSRAPEIPSEIRKKLSKESPDLILCTGDLGKQSLLDKLKEMAEVKIVRGNTDSTPYPTKVKTKLEGHRIVMIHGSQISPRGNKDRLNYIAQEEEADILIHAHTHKIDVEKLNGKLLINPGSATGARSGGGARPEPSFISLKLEPTEISVKRIYRDREEEETYELN